MPGASVTFKVAPARLGLYELKLAQGALRGAMKEGNRRAASLSLRVLQRATKEAPPASANGSPGAVDTKRFLRGWRVRASGLTTTLLNLTAYALYVDGGRARNRRRPPVAALIPWVRRKLGLGGKQARGAAFVIARAIGKRGLRPRKILATHMPNLSLVHLDHVTRALDRVLKETR